MAGAAKCSGVRQPGHSIRWNEMASGSAGNGVRGKHKVAGHADEPEDDGVLEFGRFHNGSSRQNVVLTYTRNANGS